MRERPEDIKSLVQFHVTSICERDHKATKGISEEFLDTLNSYDWPGNVRELVQVLEYATASAADEPMLFPEHLPLELKARVVGSSFQEKDESKFQDWTLEKAELPSLKNYRNKILAKAEKQYLQKLMALTNGNIRKSCQISGLSRTRLYVLLKEYQISR